MPAVVGDLNQKYLARIQAARNAQFVAQPTQALDNSTLAKADYTTVKNADTTPVVGGNDMNTTYGEATGYLT